MSSEDVEPQEMRHKVGYQMVSELGLGGWWQGLWQEAPVMFISLALLSASVPRKWARCSLRGEGESPKVAGGHSVNTRGAHQESTGPIVRIIEIGGD